MRWVALKSIEQQDIQAIHRIRSELVKQRTAKGNQIRGLLSEYGIIMPQRLEQLRRALPCILEDAENGLSDRLRRLLQGLWSDLQTLEQRVSEMDSEIKQVASESPLVQRLETIPGIGSVTATALVAAIGDGRHFKRGRELAAWLGLVPRQHSRGGKERLLGISKRGDSYLGTLLIHGARAVLRTAGKKSDRQSQWVQQLSARRNPNIAAVALANKNARIAWALLQRESVYQVV